MRTNHEKSRASVDRENDFSIKPNFDAVSVDSPSVADESIKWLIDQALRRKIRLHADRVVVSVRNAVVKLWGSVPSFEAQQRIAQAARATRGVKKVENYLKIEA